MKYFIFAGTVLATVIASHPALATNARQAIRLCEKNPNCSYRVADNGSVFINVKTSDGSHQVNCPQEGQCTCDTCIQAPKAGVQAPARISIDQVLKRQ